MPLIGNKDCHGKRDHIKRAIGLLERAYHGVQPPKHKVGNTNAVGVPRSALDDDTFAAEGCFVAAGTKHGGSNRPRD